MKKPNVAAKADTATKTKTASAKVEQTESTAKPNTTAETTAKAQAVEKQQGAETAKGSGDKAKATAKTEAQQKAEKLAIERKEQKFVISSTIPFEAIVAKKSIRAFCFATAKALQDANGCFTLDEWRTALVENAAVAKEKFNVQNLDFTNKEGKPNGRCVQHTTWFAAVAQQWVVPAESAKVE